AVRRFVVWNEPKPDFLAEPGQWIGVRAGHGGWPSLPIGSSAASRTLQNNDRREEGMGRGMVAALAAGFLVCSAFASGAQAAEIRVLCTIGVKPALPGIVAEFERTTGHKVNIDWGNASTLKTKYLEASRRTLRS